MSAYDMELVGAESVIMEMAEYTHLQHMLFQVHTDTPTGQVIDLSTSSDEPCICILPDHRLLHETMELERELELVMDYGGGGGGGGGAVGEKTRALVERVKREASETLTEVAAYSCGASLNRPNPNSSARACLEKRFRCRWRSREEQQEEVRLPGEQQQTQENHNYKERDRRRRIRMHCRELNSLVPFCTPTTDKATTLQWTTAFVRHIQDVYGDTLKEVLSRT
ncbi:hypothetical protein CRUP_013072 [Coryphaenoides rupestris]|nr:hypothetical protein CRUP_013072 [Coryphaenoides rupestris]